MCRESADRVRSADSARSTAAAENTRIYSKRAVNDSKDNSNTADASDRTTAKAVSASYSEPYECLIEPMMLIQIGSETQGLIDEVLVDRGEDVKRGQIIARLKSAVETRRVEQAKKRASMHSEIDARTADLELAELVLDRATSLENEQLASSQELDEARALYRVAEAELQQAQHTQAQLELDLLLAQALLEQRVIRSPIDGFVIEQHAFAGEVVQDKPIMTVAQLNPLRAEVILPLSQYGRYEAGALAKVTQERGGDVIEGYLEVIDPLIDSGSGTFGIRVHLDNSDGKILAGQTCSVLLQEVDEAKLISASEE